MELKLEPLHCRIQDVNGGRAVFREIVDIIEYHIRHAAGLGYRGQKIQHFDSAPDKPTICSIYADAKDGSVIPHWSVNARYEEHATFLELRVTVNGPDAKEIYVKLREMMPPESIQIDALPKGHILTDELD